MKNIIVIGGGAAGMIAAIAAAQAGAKVTLLEKNEKLGKKIYITGKGRCNVTNACDISEMFDQVVSNPRFLYSALYGFTNTDMMQLLRDGGCELKIERGDRVFPESDHSYDVTDCLKRYLNRYKVRICLRTEVKSLCIENGVVTGVELADQERMKADCVICATGGLSYQTTGSTGDGLKWAEKSGHRIVKAIPALVPLETQEDDYRFLQGLSLRNIGVKFFELKDQKEGKKVFDTFGEMLFTHFGISGPVILSASSLLTRKLSQNSRYKLHIDLKPALSEKQLDERILRDFSEGKNRQLRNCLGKLYPAKLIPVLLDRLKDEGVDVDKQVNEITRQERGKLCKLTKDFSFVITGTRDFKEAIITQGGIDVKDIDPSTMESNLVKNLYFAGEMIDIDAFTGGFNLQLAWSTGHLAGVSAAE